MEKFWNIDKVLFPATLMTVWLFGLPAIGQTNCTVENPNTTIEQLNSCITELAGRLSSAESNISQTEIHSWLTLIVAIAAALAGAWLGGYLSKSAARQAEDRALSLRKKEATISICSEWIGLAGTIASVTSTLENVSAPIEARKLNEISMYGNWLEMVLLMKADNLLDEGFLNKFGFENKVEAFREKVVSSAATDSRLQDYLNSWNQIANT